MLNEMSMILGATFFRDLPLSPRTAMSVLFSRVNRIRVRRWFILETPELGLQHMTKLRNFYFRGWPQPPPPSPLDAGNYHQINLFSLELYSSAPTLDAYCIGVGGTG